MSCLRPRACGWRCRSPTTRRCSMPTQSKLGGNVDGRQMQELPMSGGNWMQLTLLAPGSHANAVVDSPVTLGFAEGEARFQLNVDGQEVTSTIGGSTQGEPRFSREALAEFELISNRFDATQGRSIGVQVNVVTKSGTESATPARPRGTFATTASSPKTSSCTACCPIRTSSSPARSAAPCPGPDPRLCLLRVRAAATVVHVHELRFRASTLTISVKPARPEGGRSPRRAVPSRRPRDGPRQPLLEARASSRPAARGNHPSDASLTNRYNTMLSPA